MGEEIPFVLGLTQDTTEENIPERKRKRKRERDRTSKKRKERMKRMKRKRKRRERRKREREREMGKGMNGSSAESITPHTLESHNNPSYMMAYMMAHTSYEAPCTILLIKWKHRK